MTTWSYFIVAPSHYLDSSLPSTQLLIFSSDFPEKYKGVLLCDSYTFSVSVHSASSQAWKVMCAPFSWVDFSKTLVKVAWKVIVHENWISPYQIAFILLHPGMSITTFPTVWFYDMA